MLHSFLLQSVFLSHISLFRFEQFLHLQPLFDVFDIFCFPFFCLLLDDVSGRVNDTLKGVVKTIRVFS